jgi:rhodanese-related sulfurtransferase
MSVNVITPARLGEILREGQKVDLVDVRTPVEFREVHLTAATNVPLDRLDPRAVLAARQALADAPLYLICKGGTRGKQACEKFLAAGYANVVNVEGGTQACVEAGLPVVRGKKGMSLERQVRIVAGLLVVTGAALGYFVDLRWIGLSAFVGSGLVFAGVTDTCGMAMLLGRMPWNQVSASCSTK